MSSLNISKRQCCTCLSEDRKLFQLYRVPDGVNLLYMLLQCDADAYREGFFKDIASWLVCWECRAVIDKIKQFRGQTCTALKLLKDIADGTNEKEAACLSHLSIHKNPAIIHNEIFIDCGQVKDIKNENAVDLVENHFENELKVINNFKDEKQVTNRYDLECDFGDERSSDDFNEVKKVLPKKKKHKKPKKTDNNKRFYSETIMTKDELKMVIENRQLELENGFKCDSCVLGFKSDSDLNTHNSEHHTKKLNHSLCDVCLSYIQDDTLDSHTKEHYRGYVCKQCAYKALTQELMIGHLYDKHNNIIAKKERPPKKGMELDEPRKYPCSECDMTFENKGAKWKHVQKLHRAGHKCLTCGKIFTFKHNLERHSLSHSGGHPRSPCPVCCKPVRTSSLGAHMRTHASRAGLACAPCGVRLACRATYAAHLKYARAHAAHDTLRYACSLCEKKYRSRGELRDHVAYRHDNQPRHKCPVCDKCLATRRCVTRHVKRAHEGLKENARDKMCDYCGKAFRDKKSLSEHVSRHTGARPHACAHCGRAFRQRAALHAHTRRIHAHKT